MTAIPTTTDQYVVQRSQEHFAMPWANGRGTSFEVVRNKPGIQDWRWRVAIAPVLEDGDFSYMANVDRQLMVIDHDTAMLLDVDGTNMLCQPFNVVAFPGDAKRIHARLLNGPLSDLGLMIVRNTAIGKLSCFTQPGPLDKATLIIALSNEVCLNIAGTLVHLSARDACIFSVNVTSRRHLNDESTLLSAPLASLELIEIY